jgi:hypothetical protein
MPQSWKTEVMKGSYNFINSSPPIEEMCVLATRRNSCRKIQGVREPDPMILQEADCLLTTLMTVDPKNYYRTGHFGVKLMGTNFSLEEDLHMHACTKWNKVS